jgi:hypothetical protein
METVAFNMVDSVWLPTICTGASAAEPAAGFKPVKKMLMMIPASPMSDNFFAMLHLVCRLAVVDVHSVGSRHKRFVVKAQTRC